MADPPTYPARCRCGTARRGRLTRFHHRLPTVTSTALLTDHYELTMLQAALHSGAAQRRCVFEVFARRLPEGRRYGVVAGTGRLVEAVRAFRFGDAEIERLRAADVVDSDRKSTRLNSSHANIS